MLDNPSKLIWECPSQNCSWNFFSSLAYESIVFRTNKVNHVKVSLVKEEEEFFTLKLSLWVKSPDSVKYLAMCYIVDSLDSPLNLVYLGKFVPLGNPVWRMKSTNGETYNGLCSVALMPFLAIILSALEVKLFSISIFSCRYWSTILSTFYCRRTRTIGWRPIIPNSLPWLWWGLGPCPWWIVTSSTIFFSTWTGTFCLTTWGICRIGIWGSPRNDISESTGWLLAYFLYPTLAS